MRIHLPLDPPHFWPQPAAGPSSPPIFQLGGELVLIELQGELGWEGDKANGVIGVLGLDRPDKPTLHLGEHHLLHGKISMMQKPYAVVRRVYGHSPDVVSGEAIDGDPSGEEDEDEEDDRTPAKRARASKTDEEDDDEPPLFAPVSAVLPQTPGARHAPSSSSPYYPSSAPRDYSSELDASSPARGWDMDDFGFKRPNDDDDDEEDRDEQLKRAEVKRRREDKKAKRKKENKARARHYEVVGVVRKKVVFALRPEPIVTATVLPE